MTNKLFNTSFSVNTDGWNARNNATIARTTEDTYLGRGAVEVILSDSTAESGVYNLSAKVGYVKGSQIIFSAYVKVPDGSPNVTLKPAMYFYNSSGTYLSGTVVSGADYDISSSDGWVRIFVVGFSNSSSAVSVSVAIQASSSYTYVSDAKFLADAFMLEDGGVLTAYTEGQIPQDYKNKATNLGLTKLPQPHLTGMKLNADVRINGLTLNTIDENDIVWVCTDIQNWWNLPGIETPDIARGLDDGSYDVRGRRTARNITLAGSILVPDPALAPAARQKLLEAVDLVYTGGWLFVDESPTKAAYVRLVGQPTIDSVTPRGRINFSVPLRAGDPIKYSWEESNNDGYTAIGMSNLLTNPSFEGGSTTKWASGSGSSSATASLDYAYDGTYSYKVTSNGTSANFGAYITGGNRVSVDGGDTYTFSMYVRDGNTAVTYQAQGVWYDANGDTIGSGARGTATAVSNSAWTRVSMIAKAPEDAVSVQPILYATTPPANGTIAYFDAAELRKDTELSTDYIGNNASNLNIVNDGNAEVAAIYKLTGPITAPAYIVSNNAAGLTQTLTILTNLRDNTYSESITASEFTAGIATITTSAAHSFLVGDVITVNASNNYYDATSVTITAVTDTSISYANPTANITSITHNSNLGTVTATAHGYSAGDTFYISGSSNPVFDGAYTVVTNVSANVFTFTKTAANQTTGYGGKISRQITYSDLTTGTVTLAQTDTLEIDTYNKTVLYRDLPDSSRSTLAVNVDWIKLYPGNNIHTFSTTGGTGDAEVKYRSGWIG
jgi:hypothetical protein